MTDLAAEPPQAVIVAPAPAPSPSYRLRPATPATFLSGGYILSFVDGPHPATGHGAELSVIQYLQGDPGPALGPLVQVQHYSSDGHGHLRVNAGAEFTLVLGGIELMYSYRGAFADVEPTHGVTFGPFLSLGGVVHVAGRFTAALSPDERSAGNEYGVTLGLKVPALIAGDLFRFGHGRPCTIDGRRVHVALGKPLPPAYEARALSEYWRRAAELERASVVAFQRLSLSLAALGAPRELLDECLRAADDEVRHSELARARAEQSSERHLEFDEHARWLSPGATPGFAELARESLVDGCIGEGVAARVLDAAAGEAADPLLARELTEVAADEARHAELAWGLLAWCLERDRAAVTRELEDWLSNSAPGVASVDGALLPSGCGALSPAAQTAISEQVWSEVVLRLHGLLSQGPALSSGPFDGALPTSLRAVPRPGREAYALHGRGARRS